MLKSKHPLYNTYNNMKQRCYNPMHPKYHRYGGRNIRVCQRWRDDFWAFVSDMGDKPSKLHTLDRENNDRSYSPKNCRWALPKQQARNTKRNIKLKAFGREQTMTEWADEYGIGVHTLWMRLRRLGMGIEDALTKPLDARGSAPKEAKVITLFGKSQTLKAWCQEFGVSRSTVYNRIYQLGWSIQEAICTPVGQSRRK